MKLRGLIWLSVGFLVGFLVVTVGPARAQSCPGGPSPLVGSPTPLVGSPTPLVGSPTPLVGSPTPPCIQPINPQLRCIEQNPDTTYTAYWGYNSENAECCPAYQLPIRSPSMPPPGELRANWFTPDPVNRGQTEWFLPGLHQDAFSTTWAGGPLTWSLRYFTITPPFWEEVSVTANPDDATLLCNLPPSCDAGGPYVQPCTGTQTTIELDGTASSDPNNDPLNFSWNIVCDDPAAVITGADTATPSVTLFAPGQGTDASCTAILTVTDDEDESSSCQSSIAVPACELDCLGDPLGSAELDLCGVCNGNNSCVDCEGVPFGGKEIDRCGVCDGDGQSCLGCEEVDITEVLMALDGNSFAQREVVFLATVRLRMIKPGDLAIKSFIEKARISANKLALDNWVLTWSFPQVSVTCSNSSFCVNSDNTASILTYTNNARDLFQLTKQVLRKMRRNARGPIDILRVQKLRAKAKVRYQKAVDMAADVPPTQSQCFN